VDRRFDEVYRLAADMSGASYIFIGEHDAGLMHSDLDLNMLDSCYKRGIRKIFHSLGMLARRALS
jgi:GDP-D-mannose 3',5'-epimerase